MGDVIGTTEINEDWLAVGMQCSHCDQASHMRVERNVWLELVRSRLESSSRSEVEGLPDMRAIGRDVAAFRRVDLTTVETVEDITWVWDYQASTDADSIPVEA